MQTIAKRIANEDIESGSISVNCSPGKTQFNICELKQKLFLIFSFTEYFFVQLETLSKNLTLLEESTTSIASNHSVEKIMISVIRYYYQLSYSVNCAKVTYQTIPNIELGQGIYHFIHFNLTFLRPYFCFDSIRHSIQFLPFISLSI
jgi:hypothetical protein